MSFMERMSLSSLILYFASAALLVQSSLASLSPAFTYNATNFLLYGEPFQIIGGQMDPQRIPYQYWSDRLAKARAMGLNTIFSYVFWDQLVPRPGSWTLRTDPQNDIARYFRLAQREGLHVVLRPGPYICGEHEWGGYPAWLSEIPGLTVRTNDEPFLDASDDYFGRLSEDLVPLLVENGGPILMVQVENEYGSYGENRAYLLEYKRMLIKHFPNAILYTNDGGLQWMLEGGTVPGVLAETDGGPKEAFQGREKFVTDQSKLGPLLDGEYYTKYPDQWGSGLKHVFPTEQDVQGYVDDLDYTLGTRQASISLYMVHGGTNWGFQNGALWSNKTTAWTTSYDYGAPIDEAGRKQFYYDKMRNTLVKYSPNNSIPEPVADIPLMDLPTFTLEPAGPLWNKKIVSKPTATNINPLSMEALGQAHGFVLYVATVAQPYSGPLSVGDRPRDRALVYINNLRVGILDSQYSRPPPINITLQPGDEFSIFVENIGRVNYYSRMSSYENGVLDPHKGIIGDVKVGSQTIHDWKMVSLPVPDGKPAAKFHKDRDSVSSLPTFFSGKFRVPDTVNEAHGYSGMDTYLAVPNGVRGEVWVNGVHLGRYWVVGPQQSLYLPGTILRRHGLNKIVVLELEPSKMVTSAMEVRGLSAREWFNKADPDCENCI